MWSFRQGIAGVLVLALASCQTPAAVATASALPGAQPTASGRGLAASSLDAHAAYAAIQVMQAGGNAVDGAVAASAMIGVTAPYTCGIGGGAALAGLPGALGSRALRRAPQGYSPWTSPLDRFWLITLNPRPLVECGRALSTLRRHGLVIDRLIEPRPPEDWTDQRPDAARLPAFLVARAKKPRALFDGPSGGAEKEGPD